MNNRPKESYIRKIDTNLETPKRILGEARNQFTPIYFLLKKPFSEIKKEIKDMKFKSFEDYTSGNYADDMSVIKEIKEAYPDEVLKYNEIIEKFKDPNLSEDEFFELIGDSQILGL